MLDSDSVWQATRSIHEKVTREYASCDALFDATVEAYEVPDPEVREIGCQALADDAANITLYNGVAETLRALQAHGTKFGVITNSVTSSQDKPRWLATQGLDLVWDAFLTLRTG